jgi:penicillin-binding protein-related factor A (putative recombinase)
MCSFLISNLTKHQIEHLIKMYFKMNILMQMTFDLVKSDKGYLYYLGTLWVSLGQNGIWPSQK